MSANSVSLPAPDNPQQKFIVFREFFIAVTIK
jgi:hypothetical protein